MYGYGYRRRGFGCLPIFFGLFLLAMIFGFHRLWFFVWPLFFVVPFLLCAAFVAMMALRWWSGDFPKRKFGGYSYGDYGEKAKRSRETGGDEDSDIFYV